jgi:peptidoglycan/LPS O-acetylase OafA/YrhL
MVQGWVDTMLLGCLLALLRTYSTFEAWHVTHLHGWIVFSLAVLAFYLMPLSQAHLARLLSALISETVGPFLIALSASLIVLYVVTRPDGLLGRLLNNRGLKHIGVLSYSLYLWQQPFLIQGGFRLRYIGFLYAFLFAETSFWLVERPTLALRSRIKFSD